MRKPNIVYIIAHDLGQQLNCYGDKSVKSPNLDELAEKGVRFVNYFCSSTPCSPSRGCIMTGRYAHTNGLMGLANRSSDALHNWSLPEKEKTIVDYLNEAGYSTYHIGVQHERRNPFRNRYKYTDPRETFCEVVAEKVVKLIKSGNLKEPFYLNAGFFEVHLPFERKEYIPDDPDKVHVPAYLPDNRYVREELARFHGSIRFMDEAVGKIISALDESKFKDSTVIVFTTDHGIPFPRAKSTLYDPGIKTTLIMRFPEGMVRNGVYKELISNIDLTPTLLEMIGAKISENIQGRSFYKLLTGEPYAENEFIFSEKNFHDIYDPIRCVRTKRYKYIRNFEPRENLPLPEDIKRSIASRQLPEGATDPRPEEELYDLKNDPNELTNLVNEQAYQEVRKKLSDILARWMKDTKDPLLKGPISLSEWVK